MRRLVFPVILASGLVMAGPSSAFADDPTPTVSVKATPGKKVCKITNTKLDELSGIVATETGFIVIDDSTDQESHKRVFFLSDKCEITKAVEYSGKGPRDTEDLILSPDGKTLWIADIGDNNYEKDDGSRRDTVSLWKMPADGSSKPTIHRLSYPEGDYHDAEALLLNGDGTPLIVTKEIGKPAYVYEPTKALETNNETGVPLKRVGQITVSATETPGTPLARIGNRSIDGGAVAPGGGKVVLRTYTDALEWDVSGGNVIAALQGKPRITALPNEPGGEAITYSPDGKTFYTVSDMNGDHDTANYIMSYVPATTVATVKKSSTSSGSGKSWYSDLTVDQIMYMVGGVGALGLVLVGIGVVGIVRFRKRQGSAPPADLDDPVDPLAGEPETELIGVGGAPQRAGVYGGARSGPAAGGGGVYGGAPGSPAGGAQRGPVYGSGGGAAGGGGPQYARPAGGQQPAGNGVYGGGQQPRGPQQPGQGQQRPPQGGQRPPHAGPPQSGPAQSGPAQGGGPRPPQGGQRPPQGGPRPPQGGQGQRPPQGAPRPPQGGGQGGGPRPPQGGPRPPQGGPRPPQGGQVPRPPQGGPRPAQGPQQGVYGKPPARPDGQMDRQAYPQGRFDNPDHRRR